MDRVVYQFLDDGSRRVLGTYLENYKIFRVVRSKKEHFMRKYQAWGVDEDIFKGLCREGLKGVVLFEMDSGEVFKTSSRNILEHGIRDEFWPHKAQIFLHEDYWDKITLEKE